MGVALGCLGKIMPSVFASLQLLEDDVTSGRHANVIVFHQNCCNLHVGYNDFCV